MKMLSTILRYVFVSPEFLVLISGIALLMFCPSWFLWLSQRIGHQAELLKYFGLLSAGLVVYDSKTAKDILFPNADKKTILQNWPFYWKLKCGVAVGFLYGTAFAVAGLGSLLFDWQSPAPVHSAMLITSVIGALTVSATLYLAQIKIEELFRQCSCQTHL